jgi:hypothetical protein
MLDSNMAQKRDPRHVPAALFSEDSVGREDDSDGGVDEERRDPVLVAALGYR